LPTDEHIPRRLSQQGIGDLRKEALLRLGEIDSVNVIDEVGGSEIGELRISKLGRYIDEGKRLPVTSEELVRQIGSGKFLERSICAETCGYIL
jgi:hypothetical protein